MACAPCRPWRSINHGGIAWPQELFDRLLQRESVKGEGDRPLVESLPGGWRGKLNGGLLRNGIEQLPKWEGHDVNRQRLVLPVVFDELATLIPFHASGMVQAPWQKLSSP